jgi:hypothetical protein
MSIICNLLRCFCCEEEDIMSVSEGSAPQITIYNVPITNSLAISVNSQGADTQALRNETPTSSVSLDHQDNDPQRLINNIFISTYFPPLKNCEPPLLTVENPDREPQKIPYVDPGEKYGKPHSISKNEARSLKYKAQNNQLLTVPHNDFKSRQNSPAIENLSVFDVVDNSLNFTLDGDDADDFNEIQFSRSGYSLGFCQLQAPSAVSEVQQTMHVPE